MQDLKRELAALAAKFDALSARERLLILAASLGLLFAAWDYLVHQPLQHSFKAQEQALEQAESRRDELLRTAESLQTSGSVDLNAAPRAQLVQLQAEVNAARLRKDQLAVGFIPPRRMPELLERLLRDCCSLRLINLETDGVRPLAETPDPAVPAIYRHGLTLEFEGHYFDLLKYLKALEQYSLFWDSIDYRVEQPPRARVRLKVFTLSFERDWLGV